MTIDQAIDTLILFKQGMNAPDECDTYDAINLSIEALKELKLHRKFMHNSEFMLMAGETTE